MNNAEVRVNLTELGGSLAMVNGKKVVVLPAEKDCIYIGTKGVYLNMTAIARKEVKEDGQTHFLKPSIPYDKFKELTQEQKQMIPIVGHIKEKQEKARVQPQPIDLEITPMTDLPF